MGQCRTLDADVTIGCYYGDCSSMFHVTTPFQRPFLFANFSAHTCYEINKE